MLGRDLRDSRAPWPAERAALLRSYPASAAVDVRLRGGPDAPRALLDKVGLPAGWLVFGAADVENRVFLRQLDFYVDFPPANTAEAFSRAALEALAAGCVVILPRRFAGTFGDAALYCEPGEVGDVVRRLWAAPESYAAQSRRGRDRVLAEHAHEVYADRIVALLTGSGTPAGDGRTRVPVPVA